MPVTFSLKKKQHHSQYCKKSENELWMLTVYGLFSVDTRTLQYTYYSNPEIDDYFAYYLSHIDKNGVLWISTFDHCFYTFDSHSNIWTHHKCPEKNKNYPDQMAVIQPYRDEGLLMLRMDDVFLYKPENKTFKRFKFIEDEKV